MKDFQVVSSLVQLKALVAGLYGRIDALAPVPAPTVDFAVDMFDREDQDTLGPYWSNTEYALRSGMAVRSAGSTPLLTILINNSSIGSGQVPIYNAGQSSETSAAAVVYVADLSSQDFSVVVSASVPDYGPGDPKSGTFSAAAGSISHYRPAARVATGAGVCIANSLNAVHGLGASIANIPAMYSEGTTDLFPGSVSSVSTPDVARATITTGSTGPTSTVGVEPEISVIQTGPTMSITIPSGSFSAASVGSNVMRAECSNDNVTLSVNGVTFFSGTPATVSRKSRVRAGIMTSPHSTTLALAATTDTRVGGVTSFKAWRNDIPEPPNETGHGTYTNGRWQYTDKYHTPVTDATGTVIRNEDGTVASYVYDPEA